MVDNRRAHENVVMFLCLCVMCRKAQSSKMGVDFEAEIRMKLVFVNLQNVGL